MKVFGLFGFCLFWGGVCLFLNKEKDLCSTGASGVVHYSRYDSSCRLVQGIWFVH